MFKQAYSKHGNRWVTVDGIKFQSKGEALDYECLKLRLSANEISKLELQVSFPLTVKASKLGSYRADFTFLDHSLNAIVIRDFKGQETAIFKWKWKHLMAEYGSAYHYSISKLKDCREILRRFGYDFKKNPDGPYIIYKR